MCLSKQFQRNGKSFTPLGVCQIRAKRNEFNDARLNNRPRTVHAGKPAQIHSGSGERDAISSCSINGVPFSMLCPKIFRRTLVTRLVVVIKASGKAVETESTDKMVGANHDATDLPASVLAPSGNVPR